MVKLLRVIHSLNPEVGGPPEGILQISPVLEKYGIKTTVACLDNPNSEWLENKPYEIIAFGKGFLNYGFQFGLVSKLSSLFKDFDLIIIHGLWQYHSFATFLALRNMNKRYFLFTHGMLDPWFKEKYPLKHLKKLIYWKIIESKVVKGSEAIFFTSNKEEYLSKSWFNNLKTNKKVINYGISKSHQDSSKLIQVFKKKFPEVKNKKIILFLSRIDYKKGIDILVKAFGRISHKYPNHILVVAGPPAKNNELNNKIKKLIYSYNLKDKVLFTGMLKGELKWGAYYSSDIYCLPSHSENFGIVVAEALSCGCLLGISNKVNIYDEIKNANAGFVFENSESELIRILEKMLKLSNSEKSKMKENAVNLFDKKFNLLNNANIFANTLSEYIMQ